MTTLLKDIPKSDLPRERLVVYGAKNLSNEELLSIIFRTGRRGESVKELSNDVLKIYKKLDDFKDMTINKLKEIKGLGDVKAISLLAAIELGRRVYNETITSEIKKIYIKNAIDAFRYFGPIIANESQENLLAIYVGFQQQYITHRIVFKGTINRSSVWPREIFKIALLENAGGVIIMHNHPSGNSRPSKSDDETTTSLMEAGSLMEIKVIDHIIVGKNDYYSYIEEGRIKYE